MFERFWTALSGRSALLVPLSLGLVLLAGVLTTRASPLALLSAQPAPPAEPVGSAEAPSARVDAPSPTVPNPTTPVAENPLAETPGAVPAESFTPTPTPTPEPTPSATPLPRIRPTPTVDPTAWRGHALTDLIIREQPDPESLPAGLLLTGETAIIDEVVTGHEVERGNATWYRVHSGVMAGYVYGPLFEPSPTPEAGQ